MLKLIEFACDKDKIKIIRNTLISTSNHDCTPYYLKPEVCAGEYDCKSDIWSPRVFLRGITIQMSYNQI